MRRERGHILIESSLMAFARSFNGGMEMDARQESRVGKEKKIGLEKCGRECQVPPS